MGHKILVESRRMYNMKYSTGYCIQCQKQVRIEKTHPNHILHLLLTLITGGFWVIVWFILSFNACMRPWKCPNCGCNVKNHSKIPNN